MQQQFKLGATCGLSAVILLAILFGALSSCDNSISNHTQIYELSDEDLSNRVQRELAEDNRIEKAIMNKVKSLKDKNLSQKIFILELIKELETWPSIAGSQITDGRIYVTTHLSGKTMLVDPYAKDEDIVSWEEGLSKAQAEGLDRIILKEQILRQEFR